jgi:hypothetical protein
MAERFDGSKSVSERWGHRLPEAGGELADENRALGEGPAELCEVGA